MPIHKVCQGEHISKMRQQGKQEQAYSIFFDVSCMIVSFRDKKAHDRACDSAQDMKNKRQRLPWISWEKQPRHMVKRHRCDGDGFYLVGIQRFFHPFVECSEQWFVHNAPICKYIADQNAQQAQMNIASACMGAVVDAPFNAPRAFCVQAHKLECPQLQRR